MGERVGVQGQCLPNEWRGRVNHHGRRQLVPRKAIAYGATSHAQKRRAREAVQKTGYQYSSHVRGYSARNDPY